MQRMLIFVGLLLIHLSGFTANDSKNHIRKGNKLYEGDNFPGSELEYRQALENDPGNYKALFNLGNSLYKQGRYDEAAELFGAIAQTAPKDFERSGAFHNQGNAYFGAQRFAESVDAYKQALRLNPGDEDSRYNLAYAMQFVEDPPPQDQQQQGENDEQDQQKENQENDQDQQPKDDQQDQQQDQQHQTPDQLTREDAERILDALNQEEQKVQENVDLEKGQRQSARSEREW